MCSSSIRLPVCTIAAVLFVFTGKSKTIAREEQEKSKRGARENKNA